MIGEAIRTNIAEKYGLDQEDVQELYEAAQDSFTEGIRELEGAVTSSDMGQIKRGAHTFKGTLANMGLDDLAAVALTMEQAAAAEDMETVRQTLSRLRSELRPLLLH